MEYIKQNIIRFSLPGFGDAPSSSHLSESTSSKIDEIDTPSSTVTKFNKSSRDRHRKGSEQLATTHFKSHGHHTRRKSTPNLTTIDKEHEHYPHQHQHHHHKHKKSRDETQTVIDMQPTTSSEHTHSKIGYMNNAFVYSTTNLPILTNQRNPAPVYREQYWSCENPLANWSKREKILLLIVVVLICMVIIQNVVFGIQLFNKVHTANQSNDRMDGLFSSMKI